MNEVTSEVVQAFDRLLPQLSSSAKPLDAAALWAIAGTLTLVIFPIPTGIRAWVEDVVVDEAARGKEFGGKRVGEALTTEAMAIAKAAGARTMDLTTRSTRVAAGKLYERMGFEQRDSRLYRYTLS